MAEKPKAAAKEKAPKTNKSSIYELKGDSVSRKAKFCPKCGPGVFMAPHATRDSCGNCGYSEWKSKA